MNSACRLHEVGLELPDPDATERLGAVLAHALPEGPPALVLALEGDLGAGKSSLARALLRTLGVQGPIRSPTYTLVEPYPTARGSCLHLDLYRLADPAELDGLGLDEHYPADALWLVEWPDRGGSLLPPPDLVLGLVHAGPGRRARLSAHSPRGELWLRDARLDELRCKGDSASR